jgi:BirA family biotin operon repressor/biotin-[acetyl-CoA-carboxylase] ligase
LEINVNNTLFTGKFFLHLPSVDSTNNYAKELIAKSSPIDGTVILADEQYAGRGQMGNTWHSEAKKNLTFSIIFHTSFLQATEQFWLNIAISLGICTVVNKYISVNSESNLAEQSFTATIKWPNDIFVGNKKIAGILIENTIQGIFLKNSIIGIGINVNQTDFEEMNKIISMQLTTGNELQRDDFFKDILLHIEQYFMLLKSKKLERLKSEYLMNLYNYQKTAFYKKGDLLFEGKIIDVEQSGLLVMELFENNAMRKIEKFMFKEIEFLR